MGRDADRGGHDILAVGRLSGGDEALCPVARSDVSGLSIPHSGCPFPKVGL